MNLNSIPSTNSAENSIPQEVIGNKRDTTSGDSLVSLVKTADAAVDATKLVVDAILVDTGTTLDTKINTIDGIVDAILVDTDTTIPAAIAVVDANVDTILAREVVVTKTATLTAQGGGAGKVIDLFTLTGTVEVLAIYGECTEATNSTTLTNLLLHLFPAGGAGVDISATGTNCAGMVVGDIIKCATSKATATLHLKMGAANVDNTGYATGLLTKKGTTATTIQAEYTSDAATDVDIKWTIRYRPITTDGAIAAA